MPGATCTWQHNDFLYNAQCCTGDIWLVMGYVRVVGVWEMCCERMGADPGETEGVPGEVWPRRKYNLDGGKALRFMDNV